MATAVATQDQLYTQGLASSRAQHFRNDDALIDDVFNSNAPQTELNAEGAAKPLLGGLSWWLVLILAITTEFFCFIFTLTVILEPLSLFLQCLMNGIIWVYYFTHNVGFVDKKLGVYLASFIIEWIPFVDLIPSIIIMFVVLRVIENNERVNHNNRVYQGIRRALEYAEAHHLG